jgi:hypothetical protein
MEQLAGHPYWVLTFDENGKLTSPDSAGFLAEVASSGVKDLFVMSHGWGNSTTDAHQLYEGDGSNKGMFPLISDAAAPVASVGPVGFVGVIWPSLWFPDPPPSAPGVAAAVAAGQPGAADAALTGAQIASGMQPSFAPAQHATIAQMGKLIDEGTAAAGKEPAAAQQKRVDEFHGLLQQLVTTKPAAPEDSGETSLLGTDDPKTAYAGISDILGSTPPTGAAEGIGDIFSKVWNGAKDALRVGSYYEMKTRAGTVGQKGLGPLLEQLHTQSPSVRVHLAGHSFGARLVSFTLAGISSAAASPVASLCLIQGAFSHWSFAAAADNPFKFPGKLNGVADRVHGPLVCTYSVHDYAVGQWYPRASFLSRQDDQAEADAASQWGGMGADGYQASSPNGDLDLLPAGKPYALTAGTFYRADSSTIIANVKQSSFAGAHSDIQHPEVAWLAVSAATPSG